MTLHADSLASLPYSEVLSQCLRIGSIISTTSSYAAQSSSSRPSKSRDMAEIGCGLQGAAFEQPGQPHVLKKEHPGNSALPTNIRHEHLMHELVAAAFAQFSTVSGCDTQVPRLFRFIERADLAERELAGFPEGYRTRENTMEMERILPMPKVVRSSLVGLTHGSQDILDKIPNKHCLLRTYLGRSPPKNKTNSLRNYPLDLATMESLGLDVDHVADSMGAAFAIMHWGAGINGDDVEFVLGTKLLSQIENFIQERKVLFYLLDFGQCDFVDLTDEEPATVYQAFKGAMVTGDNQLFVPNLVQRPDLYKSFREGYIRAGKIVLQQRKLGHVFDVETFLAQYEEYAQDFL